MPPALALGAIVALKIFPWTLAVWLLITRRYRALALTVATVVVLVIGGWGLVGFHGLARNPQMLSNATYIQEGRADAVATLMVVLGASPRVAQGIALLCGLALLALTWRMQDGLDGDRRAFGLAIIAGLVARPLVWDHDMVLLFVPIALLSPGLGVLWFIPVVTPALITYSFAIWPDHGVEPSGSRAALHAVLGYLLAEAVIASYLCTTPERRARWVDALTHRPQAIGRI